MTNNILWFTEIGMTDVAQVGGKNASLGEMVSNLSDAGVSVPGGFATTADAYREFLAADGLYERIRRTVEALDVSDVARARERRRHTFVSGSRSSRCRLRSRPTSGPLTRLWSTVIRSRSRCRGRCGRARPRKTCRTRPSPVSRRRS